MADYKLIVDCETGRQEYIALTAAEIAERDQQAAAAAQEQQAREDAAAAKEALKASARAKLVAGQALTEEEAGVLIL